MCQFINFNPFKGKIQPLPAERKYVLVRIKNLSKCTRDPIVVGYLKFYGGRESEPYFITPGANIEDTPNDDDTRVYEWCDCLPNDFEYPNMNY